jgi:hypothetical protein
MRKSKKTMIHVQGSSVTVLSSEHQDTFCLTDIAKFKNPDHPDDVIRNWLRSRTTIEFLGVWERLNNPCFNPVEFDGIRMQAGLNSFVLTPKQWIEKTGAIGLTSSPGRYGGTYAHKDIAFEFASWVSVEFKLYLIKEFQRLKDEENDRLKLGWNLQRTLAKINYRIHTDAIQEKLIPPSITQAQSSRVYADEADLLNVAIFGQTAKQWRDSHPDAEGNVRDQALLEQLIVLTNLESLNSVFIRQGPPQPERLQKLNEVAISQMRTLISDHHLKRLK